MFLRYFLSLFFSLSAFALTIDNFDGDFGIEAGTSSVVKDSFTNSSAIGGKRKYLVYGFPSGSSLIKTHLVTTLGYLAHSQDTGATGLSRMDWDGTTDVNNFSASGLGGIDFTQDGSNAIQLDVLKFDYPNDNPVTVKVYLYSTDGGSSVGEIVLNNNINSKTSLTIPFSSFVSISTTPVDIKKIGAVSLEVWGLYDGIDFALEWIGTNSTCLLVPDSAGKVVDECSVCGGDNSSCSDCMGVPYGTAVPGTSCQNGEKGVCAGGIFNASCGCVRNVEPTSDICDGIDNDCDGQIDEDFSQKNSACSIGTGLCSLNGTFICSPAGGIMCSVDPQQPQVDACESTKGCDGVPNSGLVNDQCGVCGGNNSTCSDCSGVPNGSNVVDRCGLCAGDGLSCLACNEIDQSGTLVKLDGLAKQQEYLVRQANKLLVKYTGSKNKAYAAKINAQAAKVQDLSWHLVWQELPKTSRICGNKEFCVTVSNVGIIEKYRTNSEFLKKLAQNVLRRLSKVKKAAKSVKSLSALAIKYHATNITLTNQVPLSQSTCN